MMNCLVGSLSCPAAFRNRWLKCERASPVETLVTRVGSDRSVSKNKLVNVWRNTRVLNSFNLKFKSSKVEEEFGLFNKLLNAKLFA